MSDAFRSACACRRVGQSPARTPTDFALFTPAIPAARSGARRPRSVAATAGVRMGMRAARKVEQLLSESRTSIISRSILGALLVLVAAHTDRQSGRGCKSALGPG